MIMLLLCSGLLLVSAHKFIYLVAITTSSLMMILIKIFSSNTCMDGSVKVEG